MRHSIAGMRKAYHNDPRNTDSGKHGLMSLEFAVQYDCPLRANYSEQHLRQWGRLSSLHAKLTTGDAVAPSVDKLDWVEKASGEIERLQTATTIGAQCPAGFPVEAAGGGERL